MVSELAKNIIGSEIIKFAAAVTEKVKQGYKVYNLTIGDFDPNVFTIPMDLRDEIIQAYMNNHTNYPTAEGLIELREAIKDLIESKLDLNYSNDEIIVACGARPIIYAIFKALVDPGDKVLFPTPSWNNNHYTYLSSAEPIIVETKPENNFMPTAAEIKPFIQDINFLCLCSPQNPTGTIFTEQGLKEIVDLVLEENIARKEENRKPIYVMYDQIYWAINNNKHFDPVTIDHRIRDYTIFVDGISKSLSATGLRVGWGMGPKHIITKMKAILTHVGAWAPKAEQVATAKFLNDLEAYDDFMTSQLTMVYDRLNGLYEGIKQLQDEGLPVDVIKPQAGIYLSVHFNLLGKNYVTDGRPNGYPNVWWINDAHDITKYLLDEAGVAVIPFYAFGSDFEGAYCDWFRASVGTLKMEDIPNIINNLRSALNKLQ
jgi:aspartate aminotransferase